MRYNNQFLGILLFAFGLGLVPIVCAQETRVPLLKSAKTTNVMRTAYYDSEAGKCSPGAIQFLTKQELDIAKDAWREVEYKEGVCKSSQMRSRARRVNYPLDENGKSIKGAAHMFIRLEKDGSIESVQPVCATNEAFAAAATKSVMEMTFTPLVCNGVPARSMIMLPFSWDGRR